MIIVLDDDRQFCDLIKIVLEMEGYQTTITHDPRQVLSLARQLSPVLILMDVHVANTDTFDVLDEMKLDEALKSIPVVMTSGIDYGAECRERGWYCVERHDVRHPIGGVFWPCTKDYPGAREDLNRWAVFAQTGKDRLADEGVLAPQKAP